MIPEENNSIEAAYELFRDAALHGNANNFSEDALIDIFDYAGDVNDDYVRLEVLLNAAVNYPESDDLKLRKAIFLSGLSNEALRTYLSTPQTFSKDQLWEILQCRVDNPSGEEAEKALRKILEMEETFPDDETIIQFVALVRALQMEDWLIANLNEIKERCGDLYQTLLFEIARVAESKTQAETGIKIMEQLTMDEPFNLDYWGLLAELQSNIGRYDDSLVSLDYAKAIAPDDGDLIALEGYIRLKQEKPELALKALRTAVKLVPDNYPARRNLLESLKLTGNTEEYTYLLKELFNEDPADLSLMLGMVAQFPQRIPEVLGKYYAYNEPDEFAAIKNVSDLCAAGYPEPALKYIEWYRNKYTPTRNIELRLFELLYINGKYQEAYDHVVNNFSDNVLQPSELYIVTILASTYLRLRRFDDLLEFCRAWIPALNSANYRNGTSRVLVTGIISNFTSIIKLLESKSNPTEEDIEPLLI